MRARIGKESVEVAEEDVLRIPRRFIAADKNGFLYIDKPAYNRQRQQGVYERGDYTITVKNGRHYIDLNDVQVEPYVVYPAFAARGLGWLIGLTPLYEEEREVDSHEP